MRRWTVIVGVVALGLVALACTNDDTSGSVASTTPPPSSGAIVSPGPELTVTAPQGATLDGFAEKSLAVAADTPFSIVFRNDDPAVPHNVQIFQGTSTTGSPVWAPEGNAMITGVDRTTYQVPALGAGTYTFNCYAHPATMVGTLTVG